MDKQALLNALALKKEPFTIGDGEVMLSGMTLAQRLHIGEMHKQEKPLAEIRAQVVVFGCDLLDDDDVGQLAIGDPETIQRMEQVIYRLSGIGIDEKAVKNG